MSRPDAIIKSVVAAGVFCAGLVAGWGVIALQVFGTASCPARSAVTAATRWTIVAVIVVLAAYCFAAGVYLRRVLGCGLPVAICSVAAFAVSGVGAWLEVVIRPAEFCF
jgi:hypothetical protein